MRVGSNTSCDPFIQMILLWQGHTKLCKATEDAYGLRVPREEIAFTARPKIWSQSQIFRYGRSIFCLPHQSNFSYIFDLCLHWLSVVHAYNKGSWLIFQDLLDERIAEDEASDPYDSSPQLHITATAAAEDLPMLFPSSMSIPCYSHNGVLLGIRIVLCLFPLWVFHTVFL